MGVPHCASLCSSDIVLFFCCSVFLARPDLSLMALFAMWFTSFSFEGSISRKKKF